MARHYMNSTPEIINHRSTLYHTNGIFFAVKLLKVTRIETTHIILDNTAERKGKLVEKRGRKATGLKLNSQGSRVAEYL
jgi:hypothetical protein